MEKFNFIKIDDNNHCIPLPKGISMCDMLTPSEHKDMYRNLIIDYIECVKEVGKDDPKDKLKINLGQEEINSYLHSRYGEYEEDQFRYIINKTELIYSLNIPIKIYSGIYNRYKDSYDYLLEDDSDLTLFFENTGRLLCLKLINFRYEYEGNYGTVSHSYNLIVV